uniref:Uncharacterized protein n=1 Tax=Romanomermis culicivorax TaxID=13658 RepID=A0A915JJM6_ROMCU
MSNQELATQLGELKGTVKALFGIIANAATKDNKREADSCRQEPERQFLLYKILLLAKMVIKFVQILRNSFKL